MSFLLSYDISGGSVIPVLFASEPANTRMCTECARCHEPDLKRRSVVCQRVIDLVWRLHGKFEVGVFRALVLFQIIEPISPPRTISEGAVYGMWEELPNVTIPFLFAEEYPHA